MNDNYTPTEQPTAQPSLQPGDIRIEHIFGTFAKVSAAPTWTPVKFQDCFALYKNGTTHRFYYYDFNDSTWRYMTAT